MNSTTRRSYLHESKELLILAGPLSASYAGNQLMSVVDTAVVGRLGEVQLAGVGMGNAFFFASLIIGMGIVTGLDPLVSQAIGAKDFPKARQRLQEAWWMAVFLTVPLSLLVFISGHALDFLSIDLATQRETFYYMVGRFPSIFPALAYVVLRGFLQASGDTRSIMMSTIVANIANVPLSILLAFGDKAMIGMGLPAIGLGEGWGVLGAAVASSVVSLLQLVYLLRALWALPAPETILKGNEEGMRKLLGVGWPLSMQMLAEGGIFVTITVLMGKFGPTILSGHQIALQMASFSFTVCLGIAAATSIRVGYAIGKEDVSGTRRAGLVGIVMGVCVMGCSAFVFWVAARPLVGLFATNETVISSAISFLYIAALFQVFDGLQVVSSGALRGAGDTKRAMQFNIISHWVIAFPLGYSLAFWWDVGPVGLWWGLIVGLGSVGLCLAGRFIILSRKLIPQI